MRSRFVTTISWIFIGLNSLLVIAYIGYIVYVQIALSKTPDELANPTQAEYLSLMEYAAKRNIMTLTFILIPVLAMLITAIALLKRKRWGYKLSIFFLWIGTLLSCIYIGYGLFTTFFIIFEAYTIAILFISLGVCSFLVWIIKKFNTQKIKEEFL